MGEADSESGGEGGETKQGFLSIFGQTKEIGNETNNNIDTAMQDLILKVEFKYDIAVSRRDECQLQQKWSALLRIFERSPRYQVKRRV